MSSPTPTDSTSKLVEVSAKRKRNKRKEPTTPTKVLGSPFVEMPRIFDDNDSPPFKMPPQNLKRSDTSRITPSLMAASARLARVMMEPDPDFEQLQASRLKRQQKKDTEKAEDKAPFKGPFLQPFDGEVIDPHAKTCNSTANDLGRIEKVFWGEAVALRLPGRADAEGNEDHQGISRHLILPTTTTGDPAISTSSTVMPPPRREYLMGSAAVTGFEPNLQEDKPMIPPADAEPVNSPLTPDGEPMRLPRAPHKPLSAPPASHGGSMGRAQRRILTSLPSQPDPKNIIYTHANMPLFLPPDLVAQDTSATAVPSAKKRRGHPRQDRVHLMMSDEEGKLQPLKKKRSVKLVPKASSEKVVSTLSPYVSTWDPVPKASSEKVVSTLSPYVSTWDQVPKASSEKVVSTLSPYVSTWDPVPKASSEKVVSTLSPYISTWDSVHKASSEKVVSTLAPYVSTWDQVPKASSEKVVSTLSPYVSTWDQVPKASSEKAVSTLSPYVSTWDQVPKASSEKVVSTLSPYVSTWDQVPKSSSESEIPQEPIPGQTTPVEYKPHDIFAEDLDADTATAAGESANHALGLTGESAPHALAGGNVPTSAASASSSAKEESELSESELETAGSNAEETCLAALKIKY